MKDKLEKLDWEDIILNIGQPVWDKKNKKWRVLEGYKRQGNEWYIGFTDDNYWNNFKTAELYLKEC